MFRLSLRKMCNLSGVVLHNTADKIVNKLSHVSLLEKYKEEHLRKVVGVCLKAGMSQNILCKHYWLLDNDTKNLSNKLQLVQRMKLNSWEDGLPFLKLSPKALYQLTAKVLNENSLIPGGNRLYYLSDTLKMDAAVVASYISERLFVYNLPFEELKEKLELLLEFGIKPERIMMDLWVLKYKPEVIKFRLTEFKKAGNEDLMPWMVKCTDEIFHKSLNIRNDMKRTLADNNDVFNYMAKRLNCTIEDILYMVDKNPTFDSIRVTKVRDMINFLLANGFTVHDMMSTPRIFAHSIKKLETRLKELHALKDTSYSLKILCKNQVDYAKYKSYVESVQKSESN